MAPKKQPKRPDASTIVWEPETREILDIARKNPDFSLRAFINGLIRTHGADQLKTMAEARMAAAEKDLQTLEKFKQKRV